MSVDDGGGKLKLFQLWPKAIKKVNKKAFF